MNIFSIGFGLSYEISICLNKYIEISNHLNIKDPLFSHNFLTIENTIKQKNIDDKNIIFIIDIVYDIFNLIQKPDELIYNLDRDLKISSISNNVKLKSLDKSLIINFILVKYPKCRIIIVAPSYINYINILMQENNFDTYIKNKKIQKKYEKNITDQYSSRVYFIPSMLIKKNMVKNNYPFFSDELICAYAGMIYSILQT